MAEKVGIRVGGVVEVHLPDVTGNYVTLCGMDGDDPKLKQEPATIAKRAKIDCEHCTAIWRLCDTYGAREFLTPFAAPLKKEL